MQVLWLNTWSLPIITTNKHINNIINYVLRLVKKNNVDVIILGELFDYFTRKTYISQLKSALPKWIVLTLGHEKKWIGQQSSGLLVLYRRNGFWVGATKCHILNNACMQDRFAAKSIIGLKIHPFCNKNSFWLFATHLQDANAGFDKYCINNTKLQLEECIKIANKWSLDTNLDYICLGDFNITPEQVIMHDKVKIFKSDIPSKKDTDEHLDYVIARENMASDISVKSDDSDNNPSDHNPIILTINRTTSQKRVRINKIKNLPTISKLSYCIGLSLLLSCYYKYM